MSEPLKAVIYLRQSRDKNGDGLAVARQEQACRRLCRERGWEVFRVLTDNDLSASTGKLRPGYEELMRLVDAEAAAVIVVWAVDRLVRRLADLESVIERCERAGVKMATVSGDLDLSTDQGRLVGRILASVARGEVERKSARQIAAGRQAAENGKPRKGCPRPFGWLDDRTTMHPEEGPAVAEAARALLAGCTVAGIARAWDKAGLRPPTTPFGPARRWTRMSVTEILTSPRVAGISFYGGKGNGEGGRREVGRGEWQPLIREDTYRAVARLLGDKSRSKQQGVRTMLGSLARCWCGNTVSGTRNQYGEAVYRCNPATRTRTEPGRGHVKVRAAPADLYVGEVVIGLLSRPDAADTLFRRDDDPGRVAALRDEAQAIRARLDALGADHIAGLISLDDIRSGRKWGDARLAVISAELAELGRESALMPLLSAQDSREVWEEMRADQRRAVVDALMTVTLHPAGQGVRAFRRDSVGIVLRTANAPAG
jgi:site-specific DNA recombinase